MTFKDQRIEKEIERYYTISKLINKYGKVFIMLTLSFIYILFNNTDFDVFAFTSKKIKEISLVNIYGDYINVTGIIFDKENIDMINDSLGLSGVEFKVIGADILYKDDFITDRKGKKIEFKNLSYDVGLVKTKDEIVLPIDLSQPINNIYKLNLSDTDEKYLEYQDLIRKNSLNKRNNKPKVKNKAAESLESLYELYNTYCMQDSIFKITNYFCDINVENMMNNLHRHNMKKDDYRKLFNAFSKNIDNNKLCKKAVEIAEYQTNFENIEGIVNIYCDADTKLNFKMAEDVYRLAYTNTSSSNITNDDVRKMYFMEMEREIYKKETLAIEDITTYLENIKSIVRHRPDMFKDDSIFSDELAFFLEDQFFKEIENKLDYSEGNLKKINKLVSTIIDGDEIQEDSLGLVAYTDHWNRYGALAFVEGDRSHSAPSIKSFKEEVTQYLADNERYFEKISFKVDLEKEIALTNGVLKVTLEDGGKITNKHLRTTLILRNTSEGKISIVKVQLGDIKLRKYIESLNINVNGKSLKLIQDIYSEKLVYPIIYNNYGNSEISACSTINGCKNNQIQGSINGQTELGAYTIKVIYTITNDGKLYSIDIKDKEFVISDKDEVYNVNINLTPIESKLNIIIKDKNYEYKETRIIEDKIKSLIDKKVLDTVKKDELGIDIINKLKNNFIKYLNVRPDDYRKSSQPNKALVGFTLNGIRFNAIVNIKTNEIEKLFIYKVAKKENILIKNTNLKFSSAYIEDLNLLKLDTMDFIKVNDIKAYDIYIDKK